MITKSEDPTQMEVEKIRRSASPELKPTLYTVYSSASDIPYTPEEALNEGLSMVRTIKTSVQSLQLGSKLRQDVWMRELDRFSTFSLCLFISNIFFSSLQSQAAPTTLIAVCGGASETRSRIPTCLLNINILLATGAGKSSILNAVLDGTITFWPIGLAFNFFLR
jgi:hypothetical protein